MVGGYDLVLMVAYILAGITVLFGILSIETPKLMRATFYFGILAVTLGMIYIALGAEFIGVIQILAYGGGIAILIVFALMFLPRTETSEEIPYSGRVRAIIGVLLALIFVGSVGQIKGVKEGGVVPNVSLSEILLGKYYLVVVLIMVLLFVTMLSASYLAVEED